ncbi:hypothetical protein Ddc_10828 [Ditylenchus destructor]|nr:hypothetical protein Ddc_10828 [Ditylenchus destructor]
MGLDVIGRGMCLPHPSVTPSGKCQLAAFGRSNGGFVSANSRPSAARTVALSVPTHGLRPLEWWLCQCQLAAFGRSNGGFVSANSRPSAARTVALSVPRIDCEKNFCQIRGIPQGGNASPLLADLTLIAMEYKYMNTCKFNWLRRELSMSFRYVDDLFSLSRKMEKIAPDIYGNILELNKTNNENETAFLDLHINVNQSGVIINTYDKTRDFNFTVSKLFFLPYSATTIQNSEMDPKSTTNRKRGNKSDDTNSEENLIEDKENTDVPTKVTNDFLS